MAEHRTRNAAAVCSNQTFGSIFFKGDLMKLFKIEEDANNKPALQSIECDVRTKASMDEKDVYSFWFGDIKETSLVQGVFSDLNKAVEYYLQEKQDEIDANDSQIEELQEENDALREKMSAARSFL